MNSDKDKRVGRYDVRARETNLLNTAESWKKGRGKGSRDMTIPKCS